MLPEREADEREEEGEAPAPRGEERLKAQQEVSEQSAPDLPAHGIGTMAQEVGEFQGLLDLLEEDINGPTGAVEIGDATGTPVHVISQELHLPFRAIDLYEGANPAHPLRVLPLKSSLTGEDHLLIGKDLRVGRGPALHDGEEMRAFGARDPEDAPQEELKEVIEIHVGFIKDNDLTGLNTRAEFPCSLGIVVTGCVDENEAWQETLEIQPHMALGCGLASAMLGPVHAEGHQFDGGGIHQMDRLAEAMGDAPASASMSKSRGEALKVSQHLPEELLGKDCLAMFARVGKSVATRWRGSSNRGKEPSMPQGIAHIIETDRMGQLRIEHRHDMTPWQKTTTQSIHSRLLGKLWYQMARNEVAELLQNRELAYRWEGMFLHTLPCGRLKSPRPSPLYPTHFYLPLASSMGWL